ncbi:putative nucleobase-ascorbate transporter 10 [Glycine max]|nr:putative nucleobase-ascorbate transporter 10 [Glycine max]
MAQDNAACNNERSAPDRNADGASKKESGLKTGGGEAACCARAITWSEALLLGFQHYLLTLGITVLIPTILVPQMGGGDAEKARVIQTLLLASGISTFLQSLLGTRLPIIIPIISIIQANRYKSYTDPYERFTQTMRGIQGALITTSCFQMAVGFFGLWRNAVRFLRPLCVVPYVTFTGLSLYRLGFPMYLNRYMSTKKPIYDRYSVLFTISSAWLFALVLTSCTAYNHKPQSTQNSCRTDRAGLISAAPWVYFPRFFQWGSPTFNAGEAFAMMTASFVSLFEYTGTCYAAVRYGSATICYQPWSWMDGSKYFAQWQGKCWFVGIDKSRKPKSRLNIIWFYDFLLYANLDHFLLQYLCQLWQHYIVCYSAMCFCNLNNFRNKSVLCISFFLGLSIPQYFTEYYHLKQHYEVLRWFNDVVTVIFMSHTTVAALVAFILDAHCPVKMMRHVKPSVWSGGRGSACTAHMLRMMNSILYHANLISFFHPFN